MENPDILNPKSKSSSKSKSGTESKPGTDSKSNSKTLIENQELIWNVIDHYFKDNPNLLVKHHLESYNQFFNRDIKNIFREKNPITILKELDEETKEYSLQAKMYFAGKEGNKIYYGKPIIFDDNRQHFMYPNEARLRNMTYATTIHIDIEVDYKIMNPDKTMTETSITLEQIYLGRFPIMLNSDLCILNTLDPLVKFNMGECKNDLGGYFIINGKYFAIDISPKAVENFNEIVFDNEKKYYASVANFAE